MKISVIIPAWKAQDFIERCLASIQKQTVKPSEILIGIDACMPTLEKCREIAKKNKKIKLYYFFEHSGCYRIRNTLAMLAKGELLVLFDADDAMYDNYIKEMTRITEKGCFGRPRFVNNHNGAVSGNSCPAEGCISIMKSDVIDNAGWEPWRCAADSEFRERSARCGMTWKQTETPVFVRYIHDENLTRAKETDMRSEYRNQCKAEMRKRKKENFTRNDIAVARCVLVDKSFDVDIQTKDDSMEMVVTSPKLEIIVPVPAADDIHRRKLWGFCRDKWNQLCSMQIVEAEPVVENGLYCKCATLNQAIKQSSSDYLIIADTDIIPTAEIISSISTAINDKEKFFMPHKTVARFTQEATKQITDWHRGYFKSIINNAKHYKEHQGMPCGGLLVASRQALIDIGLYDEQLIGWGGEDYELSLRIGNRLHKGNGVLLHLWHEPQPQKDITSKQNIELVYAKHHTKSNHKATRSRKVRTVWVGNRRYVVDEMPDTPGLGTSEPSRPR